MRVYTTKELGAKMAQMRKARANNEISGKEYNAFYDALPLYFTNEFIGEALRYSLGATERRRNQMASLLNEILG